MASLYQPTVTRRVDVNGKRCAAGTPGERMVSKKITVWYGKGIPGRTKPVPLARNKRVAQALLAEMVLAAERGEACLAPIERNKRTVLEWVEEWRVQLAARGLPPAAVMQKTNRVQRLVAGCQWTWPGEIANDGAERWLADFCARDNIGPQTRNFYLEHIKAFAGWLVERGILGRNPFPERLRKLPVAVDLRRARRALTLEELTRLLATTRADTHVIGRMNGETRYHLYLLTCAIGFRRLEMSRLTPAHFEFDAEPPVVLLPARQGKNHKTVRQPLPRDIAEMMRAWIDGKPRAETIWPRCLTNRSHHCIQRDTHRSGVAYRTETPDGPVFADFHSLRHTYISLLEEAGVSLKQAMQLARHSDPRLTMARYGKANLAQLSASVQRLPLPGSARGLTPLECDLVRLLALTAVALVVVPGLDSAGAAQSQPEPSGQKKRAA